MQAEIGRDCRSTAIGEDHHRPERLIPLLGLEMHACYGRQHYEGADCRRVSRFRRAVVGRHRGSVEIAQLIAVGNCCSIKRSLEVEVRKIFGDGTGPGWQRRWRVTLSGLALPVYRSSTSTVCLGLGPTPGKIAHFGAKASSFLGTTAAPQPRSRGRVRHPERCAGSMIWRMSTRSGSLSEPPASSCAETQPAVGHALITRPCRRQKMRTPKGMRA